MGGGPVGGNGLVTPNLVRGNFAEASPSYASPARRAPNRARGECCDKTNPFIRAT